MPELLEFSEPTHTYYVSGREVPSVTQILNHAGLVSPFAIHEAAAERGKAIHGYCAEYSRGNLDMRKVPRSYRGYIRAWIDWCAIAQYKPELIEARVDCAKPPYAGTLDSLGVANSTKAKIVVDIKTGAIGEGTGLQLAAYAHGACPGEIILRCAVQLKLDGRFSSKFYPAHEFATDLQTFLIHAENYSK